MSHRSVRERCLHGEFASACRACDVWLPMGTHSASLVPVAGSPYEQALRLRLAPIGPPMLYRGTAGFGRGVYYLSEILPGLPSVDRARTLVAQGQTRPSRKGAQG